MRAARLRLLCVKENVSPHSSARAWVCVHLYGVISIILGYSTGFNECLEERSLNGSHCWLTIQENSEAVREGAEKEWYIA